mmetsp:Transcript_30046/g.67986  ORF Transcript_30046/g.67986 Transcript_30046/m.67986 type:complete len:232 (+) Transcript_30046:1837-2532(+)
MELAEEVAVSVPPDLQPSCDLGVVLVPPLRLVLVSGKMGGNENHGSIPDPQPDPDSSLVRHHMPQPARLPVTVETKDASDHLQPCPHSHPHLPDRIVLDQREACSQAAGDAVHEVVVARLLSSRLILALLRPNHYQPRTIRLIRQKPAGQVRRGDGIAHIPRACQHVDVEWRAGSTDDENLYIQLARKVVAVHILQRQLHELNLNATLCLRALQVDRLEIVQTDPSMPVTN